MGELLVVRSKVKEVAKGCNVASDFAEALNDVLVGLLNEAETRCQENKRSTVMPKDVPLYFLAGKKAKEMLIVKSKVKENVKDCNCSSELGDALNMVATYLVNKACERCGNNKRSTIQPRDL